MSKGKIASIKLTCYNKDVYEPSDDSFLLADALLELSTSWRKGWPRIALEIGSGSGYIITSLALILQNSAGAPTRSTHQLFATDLNPAAAAATLETLQAHGVANSTDLLITDLASGILPRLAGAVDLLLFNPPYVPTPEEEVERGGIAAAWAGGWKGRRVIDRLMPLIPQLLSESGEMLMVTVPDNDPQELIQIMNRHGFTGMIVAERAADEEFLQILHFQRRSAPSS
ncbi:putative Methyltransferase N6AMT1 [Nannochloris sp. 'desiccata']|nr:hypothetical protein KSW81_000883 [Chlorella desiccata (nom. nud.)]KAH7620441.1 putative Methyltransferase N6AMT1 [Chlorella desiccata (nom. nud.)]